MVSLRGLLAACLVASPAGADLVDFDGSYSLLGLGGLAPVGIGTGVAELNPSGQGGAHLTEVGLPGGLATIMSTTTPTTPPSSFPYTKIIATVGDGPGAFSETSGGVLRGALPITGNVRICLGLSCAIFLDLPLTESGTRGVGLGGAPITAMIGSLVVVSLQGAPWSTGTVPVSTSLGATTVMGHARGAASQTSSTAAGSGVVQMVTPIVVTSTASGSPPAVLDLAGVLNLQLAPEPGRGALLAAGAIALFWLARVSAGPPLSDRRASSPAARAGGRGGRW